MRLTRSAHRLCSLGGGLASLLLTACGDEQPPRGRDGQVPGAEGAVSEEAPPSTTGLPSGRMTGLYVYFADAAGFTDCVSGDRWPVATEGASVDVERMYLQRRSGPQEPTLVTLSGRVALRLSMEGERQELQLVVDTLLSLTSEVSCPGMVTDRPLAGVRWQVEWLPGSEPQSGAWLSLDEESGRLAGHTGCRVLSGAFEWTGTRLRFGSLDALGGACGGAAGEAEAALLEALRVSGSYRIRGDTLELMGETGVTARLSVG